jgi:hypothetical protein
MRFLRKSVHNVSTLWSDTNYILTRAEAVHQTPAAVIAGLVREKLAM